MVEEKKEDTLKGGVVAFLIGVAIPFVVLAVIAFVIMICHIIHTANMPG